MKQMKIYDVMAARKAYVACARRDVKIEIES